MQLLAKVFARYGAIAGVLGSIFLIVLYYLDRHPFLFPIYFDFRIVLIGVFIFFAMKEYRDFYKGGVLYFWEGICGSLVFVFTFTFIVAMVIFIFEKINPEFISSYIKIITAQLKSLSVEEITRIGKDEWERNLEALPYTNVFELPKLYIKASFAIGSFISIIISVILKKQPKS